MKNNHQIHVRAEFSIEKGKKERVQETDTGDEQNSR
jgi:hypothetical protein